MPFDFSSAQPVSTPSATGAGFDFASAQPVASAPAAPIQSYADPGGITSFTQHAFERMIGNIPGTAHFLGSDVPAYFGLKSKYNPFNYAPTGQQITHALFGDVPEPTTPVGRIADAGVQGLFAGGPAGGVSAAAAQGANEIDPGNIPLTLLAGGLAHPAVSLATRGISAAHNALVRPYTSPDAAGVDAGAGAAAQIDNSLPGVAKPSPSALLNAGQNIRSATDDLGAPVGTAPGIMGGYRDFLTELQQHLSDARDQQAAPFYNQFRAETPMDPPEAITQQERDSRWPLSLPAVSGAMGRAATNMIGDTGGPRAANNPYGGPMATVNWTDFNPAGDPVYRQSQVPTPDLLDRTKRQLSIKANQANSNSGVGRDPDTAASLTNQVQQMADFTKNLYPNTYPQALDAYAKASVPLTPFEHPDVASVLQRNESANGKDLGPVVGDDQLLDRIGASPAPGRTLQAFINATGVDSKHALAPVQDAIVAKLRDTPGVIDPTTGEIDPKAFDQATRKYMPTVSMYFPELGRKFGTAKDAQSSLDLLRQQDTIASGISNGALRDQSGVVTPQSFRAWINTNRKTLTATQSPGAMMRLDQIANALPDDPFALAEKAPEAAAATAGFAGSGGETMGAILGDMIGKFANAPLGRRLGLAKDAYSQAIERLVTDPAYANQIGAALSKAQGAAKQTTLMRALSRQVGGSLVAAGRSGSIAQGNTPSP